MTEVATYVIETVDRLEPLRSLTTTKLPGTTAARPLRDRRHRRCGPVYAGMPARMYARSSFFLGKSDATSGVNEAESGFEIPPACKQAHSAHTGVFASRLPQ